MHGYGNLWDLHVSCMNYKFKLVFLHVVARLILSTYTALQTIFKSTLIHMSASILLSSIPFSAVQKPACRDYKLAFKIDNQSQ